ncbi:MAG: 2,3-bisphosphoglycerate-dependent phosphoglycerate mutase [Actinomycetota bacterium]|nr:2,3-bisphosphoglycerate-dependent phosphoglycerate mutase [Actinomycetota bacterium]
MSVLVLLRHGQSTWNRDNLFTGWVDVDLSELGEDEARRAGRLLGEAGLTFDVAYTSLQKRAIRTLDLALRELDALWLPVHRHWRLNERHYGALQGKNKKETREQYGDDQLRAWRRGYATPPPPLAADDPAHPRHDPRYRMVPPDQLPSSECLADVVERMLPYWHDVIAADLRAGNRVIVSAHGNSLRALVKHLDGISDDDIADLNIPTGIPLLYELDDADPCRKVSARYLDPEAAEAGAAAVAEQAG